MWFTFVTARLFIFLSFQPRLAATLLRSCSVVNSPTRRVGLAPTFRPASLAQALLPHVKSPQLRIPLRFLRGYEFCQRGVLKNSGGSCRKGRNGVTLRICWDANQQMGFRKMLEREHRSHSPFLRMSTGAKHLHGDRPGYLSACKRLTRFRPLCTSKRTI
jgi:hypothetical protein